MNLENEVRRIVLAFEKTWTFDVQDLTRPCSEQILRDLIGDNANRARLEDEFFGNGPLSALLNLSDIQEIIVNGRSDIWYERAGTFNRLQDGFLSEHTFKSFIDRLCIQAAMKIDLEQPFVNGRWQGFRVHLACAPLTHCSYHLCLRRLPEQPWTLAKLEAAKWCTPKQGDHLRELIHQRKNTLLVGTTGCGKTSVLGACLKEVPANERVVILEDTDELPLPNSASTKLLTRAEVSVNLREVSLAELVKQSLRMRPFRLAVGEVRGAEAKDLLLALATGHSGSWGTLHAADARQALLRLEMLIQMGAPQWNLQAIRQLVQLSVDVLVVCGMKNGHRCLEGIYRVAALEAFGILLEPVL